MKRYLIPLLILWAQEVASQSITVTSVVPIMLCAGDPIAVNYTRTGTFDNGNVFTAQLSDASGSFANPVNIGTLIGTGNGTIAATIPLGTPNGTNYRIRVISSSPAIVSNNVSAAITVTTTTGDPSVFGNGEWIVYAFQGNIFQGNAVYKGFYKHSSLNFDSNTRWGQGSTPSNANNAGGDAPYTGCVVGVDNHSVSYKRTNFTCGYYQVDITHTDYYEMLVDGVVVASNTGNATRNNRWRGILGAGSQVEFRWYDDTNPNINSRLVVNFTMLSGNDMILPPVPVAICANNSATINLVNSAANQTIDFRIPAQAGSYTFTWAGPAGFTTNADGTQLVTAPGAAGVYTLTVTHSSGCVVTGSVTVNVASPPAVTVAPANPTICAGESITLTASGAISYLWSNGANTASITVAPTVTTTYTVTGSDGCNSSTVSVTVNVLPNPTDPGTFGNGYWFVACYQGNNFQRYFGYYTENNLSFNTTTRWAQNSTPSNANAATGLPYTSPLNCNISIDNHSYTYRRTNFICGYYRIRILQNDDHAYLLVNGNLVWQRTSSSNANVTAWEGFLGATSTVEIRAREFGGNSRLIVDVEEISATLNPIISPKAVTICQGTSTNVTTNGQPVAVFYNTDGSFNFFGANSVITWTQVTGNPEDFTITPNETGATVTANVTPNPNPAIIRATFTDPLSGCSISRDVSIMVDPLPTTSVTATNLVICLGESTVLTASGANTYTWSPAAGLSSTTGHIVTASPTVTTTYTVSGSNNCTTVDATITITVINPGLTGSEFGTDEWIAHCYNGAIITNPANAVYRGYYTEKSISFNSQSRWPQNQNPTLALPLADGSQGYNGCTVTNDNHSIVWKRTNFPCGFYTISVGRDDRYELWINGNLVASSSTVGFTSNVWSGLLTTTSTVEFRVQENTGNSYGQLSIGFALGSAATTIWTGTIDNNWFNPLNWCPVVPTKDIDAIIPGGGVTNFPIINAIGAETRNILIATGATLTINTGFALNVHGDYQQDGVLVAHANSSVRMLHNNAPASAVMQVTGMGNFYNLEINKLSHQVTLLSDIEVSNQLILENGELNLNGNTVTIQNSALTAIIRNNNAYIRSETNDAINNSRICWNTGTNIGPYVFPFGVSASEYIPVTFNKLVAANTTICIATRATGADNTPYAAGVTHMTGVSGATAVNDVIDRWWNITSTVNPLPLPGAHVTFRYRGVENTLAPSQTDNIAVQHWNGTDWDPIYPVSSPAVTLGIGSVMATNLTKFSPFVLVREIRPLPVHLLEFLAEAKSGFVFLQWRVAQKINDETHIIERSTDGRVFEKIAIIKPENQDSFAWIDKQPLQGVSYYRLKRIDTQGNVEYSPIKAVNLISFLAEGIFVIPNPSNGEAVLITLQGLPFESGILTVTDALGKVIYEKTLQTNDAGRAEVQLGYFLSRGIYIVQVHTDRKVYQEKMVVR